MDQQRDMLSQTFLACPDAENFYSWCDSETRLELDNASPGLKWIHLCDQELPALLKGKEESLPAVCAALAHALGYQNKCQQLAPEGSAVLRNRMIKKPALLSLFLILFLSLIFEVTSLIQILKFRKENKFLSGQIEKTFYSVFPRAIPMVDPLKQFKEKMGGGKSLDGTLLRPEEFMKILSMLHNAKPESIKIFRISLHAEQIKVEGKSLNLEALESWAHVIQNKGFKNVKLDDVNRHAEENTFVFNLIIHLNDLLKERKR
jgi:type II secretory pathway component PulL